ncbi:MAG: ATPase [Kiritimatiellae bacterium]|nr:ATPase [Kiritimatiellia bacterium]
MDKTAPTVGIELGSTRIKAVAIDAAGRTLAAGAHEWENILKPGGVWTYPLAAVDGGVAAAYAALKADWRRRTGKPLRALAAVGVSGMMHGYLPFDRRGRQLCDFRTWRCTITARAAVELTRAFKFNIPQRWSVAHLYERILDGAPEVRRIDYLTTVAGYVHWRLTGRRVVGAGEASGMFPLDPATNGYNAAYLRKFERMTAGRGMPWRLADILPTPLAAGEDAGGLTAEGAAYLDPSGELAPGAVAAPPEGDVQTGMVATDSVAPNTANVSAGTSVFGVVALEKALRGCYPEIDVVSSPTGGMAAMSHANTCTSDINAWVKILGGDYGRLFRESLKGAPDCGGVTVVPYVSGEPIAHVSVGRPLVVREPGADFTLANFMRASLYSAFATMVMGFDILSPEGLKIGAVTGHGGIFKTPGVAQRYLADALNASVTCMETAGEGGAWGMALLAAYALGRRAGSSAPLEDFLSKKIFRGAKKTKLRPSAAGVKGFRKYLERFRKALAAERAAGG